MKKNIYFRSHLRRKNLIKEVILNFFLSLCSGPRLLLEVFIRKNFGERYFNMASVVSLIIPLLWLPFLSFLPYFYYIFMYGHQNDFVSIPLDWGAFFGKFTLWYLFTGLFAYVSYQRHQEIKRNPSVFDFAKFSLYAGDIDIRFISISRIVEKSDKVNWRKVQILYEPAPFLVLGLLLWALGQPLGWLFIFCSLVYSISYVGSFHIGDNFMMDLIDEMICNEEMVNVFVNDESAENARGLRDYSRKPTSKDLRQKLLPSLMEEEPASLVQ